MREHDMQAAVTNLRVAGAVLMAAATKDRLLLRREKESMDYDRGVLAAHANP